MKTSRFLKGLSWLLLLNVLIKPVWIFMIDRQIQVQTGNETYGQYFAVLNLTIVLLFLADAGLSTMANQVLASRPGIAPGPMIRLKVLLLLIYSLLCFFAAFVSRLPHKELLWNVVLIQVITSALVFTRSLLTAAQNFKTDAWISILDKALMIIICAPLLYSATGLSLMAFLRIQILTSLIALIVCAIPVYRYYRSSNEAGEGMATIVRRMIPFALTVAVMAAHTRLDGFLLERLHPQGSTQAGIYAASYRLIDAGNMIGYLAASFLVPYLAFQKAPSVDLKGLVLLVRNVLVFISAGLAGLLLAAPQALQNMLYHTHDPQLNTVLALGMPVLPAYMLVHVYGSILTARGRLRRLSGIVLAGLILNLFLNLYLIPRYGATGCAVTALASQYLTALLLWYYVPREENLRPGIKADLEMLVPALTLTGLIWLSGALLQNVWSILATSVILTLLLLLTQTGRLRKLISSS